MLLRGITNWYSHVCCRFHYIDSNPCDLKGQEESNYLSSIMLIHAPTFWASMFCWKESEAYADVQFLLTSQLSSSKDICSRESSVVWRSLSLLTELERQLRRLWSPRCFKVHLNEVFPFELFNNGAVLISSFDLISTICIDVTQRHHTVGRAIYIFISMCTSFRPFRMSVSQSIRKTFRFYCLTHIQIQWNHMGTK